MATFVKTGVLAIALFTVASFASCTDVIEIDSGFENSQAVVDAWLTDASEPQTVRLWLTQDYFSNAAPPALTGATVILTNMDNNQALNFIEEAPGEYVWRPSLVGTQPDRLGFVGTSYRMDVTSDVNGEQLAFTANSTFMRVPTIDSIVVTFEESQLGLDEGLYAELFARDLPGVGDRYLIRTTINDTLLNRPGELNLAADAAFDGGTASDGIPFILPIRTAINKVDDDGSAVPLVVGDSLTVEIWSITDVAFEFLNNAETQIQNSSTGLFSVPVVSTRGNVTNSVTGAPALGMFSLSLVSRGGKLVD